MKPPELKWKVEKRGPGFPLEPSVYYIAVSELNHPEYAGDIFV